MLALSKTNVTYIFLEKNQGNGKKSRFPEENLRKYSEIRSACEDNTVFPRKNQAYAGWSAVGNPSRMSGKVGKPR